MLLFVILITLVSSVAASLVDIAPTAPDLIRLHSYPVETHMVRTEDGYILSLFRIPYSIRKKSEYKVRPIVFLMHGFMMSADVWILSGPNSGLAYNLADAGFDVFMGNARGNRYGKKHGWIPVSSAKFWEFSWTEIAKYDLKAMIFYVLKLTRGKSIHYISHAEGSTCLLVLLAERPRLNKFFISAQLMAPMTYMKNAKSPILSIMAPSLGKRQILAEMIGDRELQISMSMAKALTMINCAEGSPHVEWCPNELFLIVGFSPENLNCSLFPDIWATSPAGSSSREFLHYLQLYSSGEFRHYDHGKIVNFLKYKKISPPNFNLSNVVIPIRIIYGDNDLMNSPEDVLRLAAKLPNVVNMTHMEDKKFSHVDYLFSTKVRSWIYDGLIEYIFNNIQNLRKRNEV